MLAFTSFALSILTSIYLSLCACKFLSVPLEGVSATFDTAGHLFLLGTVPSLDFWGTTLLLPVPLVRSPEG